MKRMLRALYHVLKLLLIPLCLVLTFVYAMLQGGFVSWFLFYSMVPIGLYSLLFPFYALRGAEVKKNNKSKRLCSRRTICKHDYNKKKISFPLTLFSYRR